MGNRWFSLSNKFFVLGAGDAFWWWSQTNRGGETALRRKKRSGRGTYFREREAEEIFGAETKTAASGWFSISLQESFFDPPARKPLMASVPSSLGRQTFLKSESNTHTNFPLFFNQSSGEMNSAPPMRSFRGIFVESSLDRSPAEYRCPSRKKDPSPYFLPLSPTQFDVLHTTKK